MLHSRPMWARRVGPSYGGQPQAFHASKLQIALHQKKPQQSGAKQVHCSAAPSSTACESSAGASQQRPVSVIRKIRESLVAREKSAVEITEAYLAKLREREPHVRSFLHVSEKALQDAQELDKRIAHGEEVGPLAGVPLAVKDNLCTRDMPSTGGSQILRGYFPPFDATAVAKLRSSGAILVGKTNMDEFGMGSSTEGSAYQVLSNVRSFIVSCEQASSHCCHVLEYSCSDLACSNDSESLSISSAGCLAEAWARSRPILGIYLGFREGLQAVRLRQ